jgi:hypothetical protein
MDNWQVSSATKGSDSTMFRASKYSDDEEDVLEEESD